MKIGDKGYFRCCSEALILMELKLDKQKLLNFFIEFFKFYKYDKSYPRVNKKKE